MFIIFDVDISRPRMIQQAPDIEEREELGYDEGEGKGAKFDATDEANAWNIDLETQDAPGVNHIKDALEEDAKIHHSKRFKEGDILLSKEEAEGEERSAATNKNMLWKKYNGVVHVPYVISSSYNSAERANILRAIEEFQKYTCIR